MILKVSNRPWRWIGDEVPICDRDHHSLWSYHLFAWTRHPQNQRHLAGGTHILTSLTLFGIVKTNLPHPYKSLSFAKHWCFSVFFGSLNTMLNSKRWSWSCIYWVTTDVFFAQMLVNLPNLVGTRHHTSLSACHGSAHPESIRGIGQQWNLE